LELTHNNTNQKVVCFSEEDMRAAAINNPLFYFKEEEYETARNNTNGYLGFKHIMHPEIGIMNTYIFYLIK